MTIETLRVLVVDDEPLVRRDLELLLGAEPGIELLAGAEDGATALAAIAEARPDVLFLDIRMPGLDGFELLSRIAPQDLPMIVFVSAYDRFALRAFAVSALDFLLKPVHPERLRETLARIRSRREEHWRDRVGRELAELRGLFESFATGRPLPIPEAAVYPPRLAVREKERIRLVPVESLLWVKADRNYCLLHTPEGRFAMRIAISDLEAQLDPSLFARIHRSTIVSLAQVRELRPTFRGEYTVTLRDGTSLRWSRGYLEAFRRFLETK